MSRSHVRQDRGGGTIQMTPDAARQILHDANWNDNGTFIVLRLGEDPGPDRIAELKQALHVLWLHWKDREGLPFDISGDATTMICFGREAEGNLASSGKDA